MSVYIFSMQFLRQSFQKWCACTHNLRKENRKVLGFIRMVDWFIDYRVSIYIYILVKMDDSMYSTRSAYIRWLFELLIRFFYLIQNFVFFPLYFSIACIFRTQWSYHVVDCPTAITISFNRIWRHIGHRMGYENIIYEIKN